MLFFRTLSVSAIALSLALLACSDSARPPVSNTGPGGGGSGISSSPDATTKVDAATETDAGVYTCTDAGVAGEIYAISARNLANTINVPLCAYRDKVLLFASTPVSCGDKGDYLALQDLYAQYANLGLVVLAFPSSQFGAEAGVAEPITQVCADQIGLAYPLFQPVDVNGAKTHPVYFWLKANSGVNEDIVSGNQLFLVGKHGLERKRFPPTTRADDPEVQSEIQVALAEP